MAIRIEKVEEEKMNLIEDFLLIWDVCVEEAFSFLGINLEPSEKFYEELEKES